MSVKVKIPTKLSRRDYLVIALVMFLGTVMVLAGLLAMNTLVADIGGNESATSIDFTVQERNPQPEPEPEPEPEPREQDTEQVPLAPVPNLGSGFSGISVSLPDFNTNASGVSDSLLGNLENVVMTEDSVDTPPVPTNVNVPYPERAKQREIEGDVLVSVQIDQNGNVLQLEILESNPPGVFDEAVRQAAENWSFTPAKYQGEGVSTWVNIPLPFKLN